jgi:hypothetical protein
MHSPFVGNITYIGEKILAAYALLHTLHGEDKALILQFDKCLWILVLTV